ncbi:hypothetical protein TSOC_005020 [Tetrabaena socialis]|uniref:Uncharacterized protein n=1 Tax=Tetrabaena socialis TaxID=47790 RepID=A0A2J8A7D2_9CHLO|nr:hypothetical protein TSOC_005020 [Tetrabaena socialis]|eukprot:PNH08415.1 hypothetical protein TSOC_005020 [Tetrabaena socialis]
MAAVCCATPCGVLRGTPFQSSLRATRPRLSRPVARRAGEGPPAGDGPSTSDAAEGKEARVERLEASIRGKGVLRTPKAPRPITIRGQGAPPPQVDSQYENMSEWNEGQLFPEGWERMSLLQKVAEIYLGRRGVLFWANKAAYASAFAVLGGWVLFRFIGPALGFYKLEGAF